MTTKSRCTHQWVSLTIKAIFMTKYLMMLTVPETGWMLYTKASNRSYFNGALDRCISIFTPAKIWNTYTFSIEAYIYVYV